METSSFSSRSKSSVQRTIFFALILSYYEDSTLFAKPIFPPVSDPAIRLEGVHIPLPFCEANRGH
jgi:hypothetical protein